MPAKKRASRGGRARKPAATAARSPPGSAGAGGARKTARQRRLHRKLPPRLERELHFFIPVALIIIAALVAVWLMLGPDDCGAQGETCCHSGCDDGFCVSGICEKGREIHLKGFVLFDDEFAVPDLPVYDSGNLVGLTTATGAINFSVSDYPSFLKKVFGYQCWLEDETQLVCEVPPDDRDATARAITNRFNLGE